MLIFEERKKWHSSEGGCEDRKANKSNIRHYYKILRYVATLYIHIMKLLI